MTGRALAAAALLLAAGCTNVRGGTRIDDGDPPRTKAELFQRFGLPDAERRAERHRWLRYDSTETRGSALGLRTVLVLSRTQRTDESVWVVIDDQNRVVGLHPGRRADALDTSLWPFGE